MVEELLLLEEVLDILLLVVEGRCWSRHDKTA